MATQTTGFLVIADLSGYTAYLAGSELEHAPAIAGDLLETIVGRLEPPFRLAKLEGDAAFVFAEDGRADGSLLLDAIEASYLAFRRRLRSIDQATACTCRSCRRAVRLDLKFVVHHGSFVRTRIAGRDELAGRDVILVHRLLKGTDAERARGRGTALLTVAATTALGIDPASLGLTAATERLEHLGTTEIWRMDLEDRWQAEALTPRLTLPAGRAGLSLTATVPVPPADAWAHLTAPALRMRWEGPLRIDDSVPGGRRGAGSTVRCVSDRLATLEEVVDWQPYELVAWRVTVPGIGLVGAIAELAAEGGQTAVRARWGPLGADAKTDPTALRVFVAGRRDAFGRLVELLGGGGTGS